MLAPKRRVFLLTLLVLTVALGSSLIYADCEDSTDSACASDGETNSEAVAVETAARETSSDEPTAAEGGEAALAEDSGAPTDEEETVPVDERESAPAEEAASSDEADVLTAETEV